MQKALSVYIHIPFCVRKCSYCDFLSFPGTAESQEKYLKKLSEEIMANSASYRDRPVRSVFFGGGTPSVLPDEALPGLLKVLRENYRLEKDAEISAEANPGTVSEEKLSVWRSAGINRVSFGCQSLKDEELKLLGRIHRAEDFYKSFETARRAGFCNINVDLMSALPGQSLETYLFSLKEVLRLKPEHVSAYSQIVEEGTPFYERYHEADILRSKGERQDLLPDEEEEREMLYQGRRLLEEAGYGQYEISNYALPDRKCRHNLCYWERGDYAGFGLGAASCVAETRWKNTSELSGYLEAGDVKQLRQEETILSAEEAKSEAMFLGLRLTKGISEQQYVERYGAAPESFYGDWIGKMLNEELLERKEGYLRLTERGQDLSNYVMAGFV